MRNWICFFLLALSVAAHAEDRPSVLVRTEPVRKEALAFTLSGYGTVFTDPSGTKNISQPRSGQITRLSVIAGQVVRRGAVLFAFSTDPLSANAYSRARSSLELAGSDFDRLKRLFRQQLATNAQLAAAKKALEDAQSAYRAQQALGTGKQHEVVRAPFDGVILSCFASQGDRIAAGKTVLQLVQREGFRARIGIQPEDAVRVKIGMKVSLFPVFDKSLTLQGEVEDVHGMIDPRTRLVDVIVKLDKAQRLMLMPGMKLKGEIEMPGASAWVVPSSAVLNDENGAYLFQDDKGYARRVGVSATENGNVTAVRGKFDPALPVVVLGNYELQDGMKLRRARP